MTTFSLNDLSYDELAAIDVALRERIDHLIDNPNPVVDRDPAAQLRMLYPLNNRVMEMRIRAHTHPVPEHVEG